MKFNLKTLALLLGGGLLGLTSCSNDTLTGDPAGGPEYAGKKVYFTAALALPSDTGTRSATDDEDAEHAADGNNQTNSNADPDYEYGYDYENDVRTMILVFATKTENKYICAAEVSGIEKAPTGLNYSFDVLAEIDYNDLNAAYSANLFTSDQEVNVYAYCNYTQNLKENFFGTGKPAAGTTAWADFTGEVIEASSAAGESPAISNTIWAPRSFLMTNHAITTTKFPDEIGKWDEYADQSNPFKVTSGGTQTDGTPLLPIYVERVAARIDFRDGSTNVSGEPNNNTYKILTDVHKLIGDNPNEQQDKDTKNLYSIQLNRMGLVNMSRNFYYLRRVSTNGLNDGSILGGAETSPNFANGTPYVVDTDATEKNGKSITATNASDYFNFRLYNTSGDYEMSQWYIDDIEDVLKGEKDQWTNSLNGGKYHIWRYVTENTIPGADNQIHVQSTGIIFKGRIIPGDDINATYESVEQNDPSGTNSYVSEKVQTALEKVKNPNANITNPATELPMLFSFDGFLYGGWDELVKAAVVDGTGGTLYTAMNSILGNWKLDTSGQYTTTGDGAQLTVDEAAKIIQTPGQDLSDKIKISDESLRTYAADNNITVYVAENENDGQGWGYYCYYFYWIRHNDNNKSGLMAPMEFATVRNNVYKLYVESINRLGHPRVKSDDPDPEDEDDPDEKPTRYIQVNIDVLPWVVRENKITF
ncbi:MAG: Mfa1 fimbrilin C-terminal domain-containing protein [Muribaculaceae bacterium]|nr:Mfa1 fimbrilin C-terminal domain-containing protein [Muribaculaceae bacterium]